MQFNFIKMILKNLARNHMDILPWDVHVIDVLHILALKHWDIIAFLGYILLWDILCISYTGGFDLKGLHLGLLYLNY